MKRKLFLKKELKLRKKQPIIEEGTVFPEEQTDEAAK